ncbi:MAG: hypothetical protein ABWZ88_13185, partial [Variovorax sp.]
CGDGTADEGGSAMHEDSCDEVLRGGRSTERSNFIVMQNAFFSNLASPGKCVTAVGTPPIRT